MPPASRCMHACRQAGRRAAPRRVGRSVGRAGGGVDEKATIVTAAARSSEKVGGPETQFVVPGPLARSDHHGSPPGTFGAQLPPPASRGQSR